MATDLGTLLLYGKKRSLRAVTLLDDQLKLFALVLFGFRNYAILLQLHLLRILRHLCRPVVVGVLVIFGYYHGNILGLRLRDTLVRRTFEDLVRDFLLPHRKYFGQFGFLSQ
jgi:hypothetical protein